MTQTWGVAQPPQLPPDTLVACMRLVLDQVDTGVLVCTADAQVLLDNEAARRELESGRILDRDSKANLLVDGQVHLPLRGAIRRAAIHGVWQLLPLQAGDARIVVAVQPLRHALTELPCAMVLLGRRATCPDVAAPLLGRLYDLTLAEQHVLLSLLAGSGPEELALARGVAVSTVRTQISSLRTKFGVRRFSDIARIVAELPPMLGVLCPRASAAAHSQA